LSSKFFEAKEKDIMQAVTLVSQAQPVHPLASLIESVEWDGTDRLRMWPITYLGACRGAEFERLPREERDRVTRYVEAAGIKWMIGAIARVYEAMRPGMTIGAQFDLMLILEGPQGIMKSSALRVLAGDFFTDEKLAFDNKDSLMVLQGRWIVEMAELEGLNKADSGAIKQFITKRADLFRLPYGRKLVEKPRRCVFAGTVNHDAYLKDDSGNRRFLPIMCTSVDLEALKRDVRQLWAEALHRYRHGAKWWIESHERELFAVEQDSRYQEDSWMEPISLYAARKDQVTSGEILSDALKIDTARWDKMSQMRVGSCLRRLDFKRKRIGPPSQRQWAYVRDKALVFAEQSVREQDDAAF